MAREDWKAKIDRLWNLFWSGGIANPLSAIEQISYLIFLKRLSDLDDQEIKDKKRTVSRFEGNEHCKWSYIKDLSSADEALRIVRDEVFPFLRSPKVGDELFARAMRDAVFIIPKPSLLQGAIDIINDIDITGLDVDTQGEIYETLLGELSQSGKNGQFLTKRHIVRTIVELVDPQPTEYICDPAAGTGGFPIAAFQHMAYERTPGDVRIKLPDGTPHNLFPVWDDKPSCAQFVGYDFDTTMARLGMMNMMLHGIEHPYFLYQDTLSKTFMPERSSFDIILTNPPFTGSVDISDVNEDRMPIKTRKTELLFIQLCLSLLDIGGRCAIIVPEGVLFGSSTAHKDLRERLVNENQIEAVISLPAGCFKPYTGVKTSILYFTKGGSTDRVWFYEVTGDGFTLDDKRNDDPSNNDLKYVPNAYRCFAKGESIDWKSEEDKAKAEARQWWGELEQIVERGYNLTAGAYAPVIHVAAEHDKPRDIIQRIRSLEADISDRLDQIDVAILEATAE
ncbi:MAG: class I SAM-dependent DNA methyltransferase [Armatimonadota bacterium]|nr:type I restriction-modification system subunit M [bacterium]